MRKRHHRDQERQQLDCKHQAFELLGVLHGI
jgi:hypothetical protein